MIWLLDGNLLCALAIDSHIHHRAARAWWLHDDKRFATCSVTQCTFLRVHMATAVERGAPAAWAALEAITRAPGHVFWDDGFPYGVVPHRHLQGPRQVTDAWLAELARRRKAKLATLDSGLSTLHADVAVRIPT